jgi:hypothetical protein
LPEDNLAKLFRRESLARDRLNEAVVALVLVFTTIGIVGFLLDLCLDYAGILAGVNNSSFGWGIVPCT